MNLMELIESTGGYVKGRVIYRDLIPYVLDGYGTLVCDAEGYEAVHA